MDSVWTIQGRNKTPDPAQMRKTLEDCSCFDDGCPQEILNTITAGAVNRIFQMTNTSVFPNREVSKWSQQQSSNANERQRMTVQAFDNSRVDTEESISGLSNENKVKRSSTTYGERRNVRSINIHQSPRNSELDQKGAPTSRHGAHKILPVLKYSYLHQAPYVPTIGNFDLQMQDHPSMQDLMPFSPTDVSAESQLANNNVFTVPDYFGSGAPISKNRHSVAYQFVNRVGKNQAAGLA